MANNQSRFFPAPFSMDKSLPLLCVRSMLLHPKGHSLSEKSLLRKDIYNGHTSDALLLPYSSVSLFPHKDEYDKPEIPGSGKSSYQLPNSHCKHFRSRQLRNLSSSPTGTYSERFRSIAAFEINRLPSYAPLPPVRN